MMSILRMKCFVCNGSAWKSYCEGLEKCSVCGFVKANDKFFRIKPSEIYSKEYYSQGQYVNYEKEKKALTVNFNNRLKKILKYQGSGNLLDVGCAYGYFLLVARKYFDAIGIDLDENITSKAMSISRSKVTGGDFLKIKLPSQRFDVITFFDSIEHLANPRKAIERARSILKEKGIIAIETPDIESVVARIQKKKWRIVDPSVHLSYFSRRTLVKLLEESGFEILEVSYVTFSRTFAQIINRLVNKNIPIMNFFYKMPITINTYDLFIVIARKK